MNYFLLSSAHEYILNSLHKDILEIRSVRKSRTENIRIEFDNAEDTQVINVPAKEFFNYYKKRKFSIDVIYATRNRASASRILLSRAYLDSLNIDCTVSANYTQCLCLEDNVSLKIEDYYSFNKFFHTFKWKTVLEQKLLLACQQADYYQDFIKLLQKYNLIEYNAQCFKLDLVSTIKNFSQEKLLQILNQIHVVKRYTDLVQLQTIALLGLYLWYKAGFQFNSVYIEFINRLIQNQDIVYPYGVLTLNTQRAIESTLNVVFETEKLRKQF